MAVSSDKLEKLLQNFFGDDEIVIKDLVGDQDHYEISISSSKFNGLSKIAQHKMVMDALGPIVGKELHAVSIKTFVK